ncbi:hypothetical protein JW968_02360 [Candidatus Woesearchaeota archaeon]|nr:hypothetical protein [Candidatus Woesearchaeota archaeon]
MKNKYPFIGIVAILCLLLIVGCMQKEKWDIPPIGEDFSEITECIVGVRVDYDSEIVVSKDKDVEQVFNNYISWAKDNDEDIFGYGNNWRFENATVHGLYEGTKYWKVTASWFSEDDQKWRIQTVFDVSENGDVVRLLGCI